MLPWFKKLFLDETVFVRGIRSLAMLGGVLVSQGSVSWLPGELGAIIMAISVFLGAGEKNLDGK